MSAQAEPTLPGVLGATLLAVGVYAAVGLVLAGLTALGTDGLKLTLVATVAGFGAAITLGGARHLPLVQVLGAGIMIIAALHGLARAGDLLLPFTTFHPISGAVAAGVCVALIYAMRRTRTGQDTAPGGADA